MTLRGTSQQFLTTQAERRSLRVTSSVNPADQPCLRSQQMLPQVIIANYGQPGLNSTLLWTHTHISMHKPVALRASRHIQTDLFSASGEYLVAGGIPSSSGWDKECRWSSEISLRFWRENKNHSVSVPCQEVHLMCLLKLEHCCHTILSE